MIAASTPDGPWRRALRGGAAPVLAALAMVLLAACGSSSRATAVPSAPALATPLASSIQTSAGTWATVAMGHLDQPLNTFWQLFFRPAGASSWSNEVQATAVATNGGLVLASPRGNGLLVGVRPTNLLTFSPLIFTSDAGRSWSTGLLDDGLAAAPDALAAASASRLLALADGPDGAELLTSAGGLSAWRTSITARALASSVPGRACGLLAITSVAYLAQSALAGASCRRAGILGVFVQDGGGWRMLQAAPPASLAHARVEVLALEADGDGGVDALLASSAGGAPSLVAAWYRHARWSSSQPLQVSETERLSSFGPTAEGGIFVLLATPAHPAQLALASAPGTGWRELPAPPAGTATLAFGPASSVQALAVQEALLSVWALTAHPSGWVRRQTIHVPIEYGSSE